MATPPNAGKLNLQGAVDLGALAAARTAQASAERARASAPEGVIIDVNEMTFEATVVAKSNFLPVVVDIGSVRSPQSQQMTALLESLTAEYAGKIVLAKVDADANPRLTQAFQLQSLPATFLVISGQVQPLFQGLATEAQLRQLFEEIVKVAQQAGLAGAPLGEDAVEAPAEPEMDPRFERAYEAIEKADWPTAIAAYEEVLATNPADSDAKAGLLQVALMQRTADVDIDAVMAAPIATAEERLMFADVLMLTGQPVPAFELLIDGVRTEVESRDDYKARLLDYFVIMGECDEVRDARRSLTNALF